MNNTKFCKRANVVFARGICIFRVNKKLCVTPYLHKVMAPVYSLLRLCT